jgi:hypothetical protein
MEAQVEESDKMNTVIAFLIAIVVVIGALISWRASVIDDAAGDSDYDGLRTLVFAEKTRALNNVNAYESYGNFVTYWRNNRLGRLINEALPTATTEEAAVLTTELKTANDLADASRPLFETRYMNRDGTYSVQRQIGEMWADASRKRELNYLNQFNEADALRQKTLKMLMALMVISIAPIFLSLVENVSGRVKTGLLGLGSLFAVAGIVIAILVFVNKI